MEYSWKHERFKSEVMNNEEYEKLYSEFMKNYSLGSTSGEQVGEPSIEIEDVGIPYRRSPGKANGGNAGDT